VGKGGFMTDIDRHTTVPTILCVDDEPGISRALVRIFRSEPVQLVTVGSGSEGLARLRQTPVDLIRADSSMPEMSGVEFLEQARALCPDAFRILLTGYAEIATVSEAVNRGQIYKIIYKPWNDEDLKLTVRASLEHYARNRENAALQKELAVQNKRLQSLTRQLESRLTRQTSDLTVCEGSLVAAQRLLDELPTATLGLDEEGLIVFANKTAESWFGQAEPAALSNYEPCPLLGRWAQERLPGPLARLVDQVIKNRCPGEVELKLNADRAIIAHCRRIETAGHDGTAFPAWLLLHADPLADFQMRA
jgi:CheY-like chemotaxis protein